MNEIKIGPQDQSPVNTQETTEVSRFQETATVNGIEVNVGWDSREKEYALYLPQIQIGNEQDCHEVLRLDQSPEIARQIFEKAVELAQNGSDVYEIYQQVSEFEKELPRKGDEHLRRV